MLTDEQIEKFIYPYVQRQAEFSLSVIRVIAKRLSKLADFDDIDALAKLAIMREDITEIQKLQADYVKRQVRHIKDDFWDIALIVYLESLRFYQEQLELRENKKVADTISDVSKSAQKRLVNVLKNPVIVMRDLKNPAISKPYTLEQAYRSIINEAQSYRNISDDLRDIALNRTETQLFDSGVRYMIDNSSDNAKDTTSANQAVRGDVLESIKDLINEMQKVMGEQFGADAVELSAHIFPAPDHAPAQGHQFSLEEVAKMQNGEDFKDLQGASYVGFERNIGEWNCRHYFMSIKKGTEPTYSQKQLDKILEDNQRGYTDENGKHRTLYECTQIQRRYEREIRSAKEQYVYAKTLGNKQLMGKAKLRVTTLETKYKQFSENCKIPIKSERIKVKDYN